MAQTFLNLAQGVTGTLPNANFSGGKLLQVQHTNYTTSANISNQGYVTTGLTCAITPSATNSKIFAMFKLQCRGHSITSSYEWGYSCKVTRTGGATGDIFEEKSGAGESYSTYYTTSANTVHHAQHSSFQFLDATHNTTSAITYTVFAKSQSGNEAAGFQNGNFPSQFTLMEIAA
tara:strand:- start:8402 stop:8926 length:525 start_codon:yes stop_codon:yes gene_type:complete